MKTVVKIVLVAVLALASAAPLSAQRYRGDRRVIRGGLMPKPDSLRNDAPAGTSLFSGADSLRQDSTALAASDSLRGSDMALASLYRNRPDSLRTGSMADSLLWFACAETKFDFNRLLPERFGRERQYALGKTSGRANILKNLENLGLDLDEATMQKVTGRIIELGDKKEIVTQDDLPYIISDVLKSEHVEQKIRVINYSLSLSRGLKSLASIAIEVDGTVHQDSSSGDGQYDAFMKALWKIYDRLGKQHPVLLDYNVSIPPGGHTDALVHTIITWNMDGRVLKTSGLDADQVESAIKATVKMLNLI